MDVELEQLYGNHNQQSDDLYQQIVSVAKDGIRVSEIFLKNTDKTKELICKCIENNCK